MFTYQDNREGIEVSLVEPDFRAELKAHYSAVRTRLWAGPVRLPAAAPELPEPPEQEPVLPAEEVAARWREVDMRLFGGRVSSQSVIYVVAAYFGIEVMVLTSSKRTAPIVTARQCAMYIMRELCRCTVLQRGMISFNLIAKQFGRHHSTVFHSIKRNQKQMNKDPAFAMAVAEITALLNRDAE